MQKTNEFSPKVRKTALGFEEYMWDRLLQINAFNKRGLLKLEGVKTFSNSISKLMKSFASGLRKCSHQLQ